MPEPWRTGKIVKIEDTNYNTKQFWIQIPELNAFDFKPGQFVTLDLPIHEQKNKRWRSYSIASHPDGTNIIELIIVLLEGGAGTTYLFNEATVGTEMLLRGPQGVFTLPDTLNKNLFLICTGTGIAPFRSMINYIKLHNIPFEGNIYLIFGCRTLQDSLYFDEMQQLEKEIPNFYYLPTYSREAEDKNVRRGYVHKVYEELIDGKPPEAHFYLCGWKNMIDDARKNLAAMGYDKKSIHFELYG